MFSYLPPEVTSVIGLIETYLKHREITGPDRGYLMYHPSAFGKAQPLDAMVQTPYGPKRMGDIRVGDEVCGADGDVNTVVAIHPQGRKPIYKVTFSGHDSVECCEDHLWEVDSRYMGFASPKVMSLREIARTYIPASGHRHYRVKVPKPICIRRKWGSILSPYTVGVLIGDGCFRCGIPMITGNDQELLDRVRRELPPGVTLTSRDDNMQHWLSGKDARGRNVVKTELVRLGLWGVRSQDRFIPDALLYTEESSRWALVQGLLDSDGTASKRGHPSFTSISKALADQVSWLVKSLGGLTWPKERQTQYAGGSKTGSTSYTLHISHADPERLFHLSRKASRAAAQHGRRVSRIIRRIEAVGEKECQCITVSKEDGLYLTDHCIVTHNCLRLMQYQRYEAMGFPVKGEQEQHDGRMLRLFENGHQMHDRWKNYFEALGVLRGIWECMNPTCRLLTDDGKLVSLPAGEAEQLLSDCYSGKAKPRVYGVGELQGVFRPAACACGCTQFKYLEVLVEDKELNFHGHADMILDFSRFDPTMFDKAREEKGLNLLFDANDLPKGIVVVDMKTVNGKKFEDKISNGYIDKYYDIQLTLYVNVLKADFGLLMYEDKDQFKLKTYKIEKKPEWWAKIREQALTMQAMAADPKPKLPPPRPLTKNGYECKSCGYKKYCHKPGGIWDDPQLEQKRKDFYGVLL